MPKGKGKAALASEASTLTAEAFDKKANHPLKSPFTRDLFKLQTIPNSKMPPCWYTTLDLYSPALPGNYSFTFGRIFIHVKQAIEMFRVETGDIVSLHKGKDLYLVKKITSSFTKSCCHKVHILHIITKRAAAASSSTSGAAPHYGFEQAKSLSLADIKCMNTIDKEVAD